MDQPFDLAAHYDLLNEDDVRSFSLLRQRVIASQNNDNASVSSSDSAGTDSDYWGSDDPWEKDVWLYFQREGDTTVSGLRRICYILRQNTLLKRLKVTGWYYPSTNFYYDSRRLSGLLPCVSIQCNRSIEILSMEYIRLGSYDKIDDKVCLLGSFLRDNPSLRELKLHKCCLDRFDLDFIARCLKRRSVNSLETFEFSHNHIGNDNDDGDHGPLDRLVGALKKNTSVKRLILSWNDIGDKGSPSLAKLLKYKKCKLEELDLSGNKLGTEGAVLLVQSIGGKNKTLKTLNLGSDYDASVIEKAILRLVSNDSSISATIDSNHTISSLRAHSWMNQMLGREPTPSLLTATLNVNHQYTSTHLKVRQKIIWNHVLGNCNIGGEDTIPIGAMPRVLSFIADDSGCSSCRTASASLLYYQGTAPSKPELDIVRLGAIFRIMVARPEICSDNSGAINAHHRLTQKEARQLRRELANAHSEIERLRLEIKRLGGE